MLRTFLKATHRRTQVFAFTIVKVKIGKSIALKVIFETA